MPVGQQFADWNSIDTSQPGILGAIAAYGVDKSGLGDFLNGKKPPTQSGVGIAPDFGSSYAKRQGVAPAQPMQPMQMDDPFLIQERQIKEDEADDDAARGMLNLGGLSDGLSGGNLGSTLSMFG